MRAADYLETRPDIDATRLAVTGASGGGLQAFYAGAVDDRFAAVMPAVALWPMSELALNFHYSGDNWAPGISRMGGMGVLIALTAPRAVGQGAAPSMSLGKLVTPAFFQKLLLSKPPDAIVQLS